MSNAFGYNDNSLAGTQETINTNIDFYNPDELAKILELTNIDKKSIINASEKYIKRFTKEKNSKMVQFFTDAKLKLLSSLEKQQDTSIVKKENLYKNPNENTTQLSGLWENQNIVQDGNDSTFYPLGTTDRKQKIEIFDDHHNVMNQEKLGVQHQPSVIQGQMNPTLKNSISRIINIDSQFRLHAVPSIKNKKYNSIVNPHTSQYSSTDYTLDFNDSLSKVLNLKLYSIQIPCSWYVVDEAYGTNCFSVIMLTDPSQKIIIGSSGKVVLNRFTKTVTLDGYNIVKTDSNNNVLNFNNEIVSKFFNEPNMDFLYINETNDIINTNGVRIGIESNKTPKVLINALNSVITDNHNRIIDIHGNPTIFNKSDFSVNEFYFNTSSDGINFNPDPLPNGDASRMYFTLDNYNNLITHLNILTVNGNDSKIREHSPKLIMTSNYVLHNTDGTNFWTINNNGSVLYNSEQTGIDISGNIIYNDDNRFKNYRNIHYVTLDNGNYSASELVDNVNSKFQSSDISNKFIIQEVSPYNNGSNSIIIQNNDGKVVIGGTSFSNLKQNFIISRFNTDGTIDTTFNNTGVNEISPDVVEDILTSLFYIPRNQNILIGGISKQNNVFAFCISMLSSDGTLNTSFGLNRTGIIFVTLTDTGDSYLSSVIKDTNSINGSIYAAGYTYMQQSQTYNFSITKLTAIGSIDTRFNNTDINGSGKKFIQFYDNKDCFGKAMIIDSTSKILLGGYTFADKPNVNGYIQQGVYKFAITRINENGDFDTTFGDTDSSTGLKTGKKVFYANENYDNVMTSLILDNTVTGELSGNMPIVSDTAFTANIIGTTTYIANTQGSTSFTANTKGPCEFKATIMTGVTFTADIVDGCSCTADLIGNSTIVGTVTLDSNLFTVESVTGEPIHVGQDISGLGIPDNTTISSFGTGNGGSGTYTLSKNAIGTYATTGSSQYTFTGSSKILDVKTINSGSLFIGQVITGTGIYTSSFSETIITSFGTGTGGVGTYILSDANTATGTGVTITGNGTKQLFNFTPTNNGSLYVGQGITGNGIPSGTFIESIQNGNPFLNNFPVTSGNQTLNGNGSNILNVTEITNGSIIVGQQITGNGISPNTQITTIPSGGGLGNYTMNNVAETSSGGTISNNIVTSVGSNVLTVINIIGGSLYLGQIITGNGIPNNTEITSVPSGGEEGDYILSNTPSLDNNGTTFSGTGSPTITVTSITSGSLFVGQSVSGIGIPTNTTIASLGTGTGGIGTYVLSSTASASGTNITLTGNGSNILDVTSVTNGSFYLSNSTTPAQIVTGSGIPTNTTISSFGTGTGGVGTYILSSVATETGSNVSMTATGKPLQDGEYNFANGSFFTLEVTQTTEEGIITLPLSEDFAVESVTVTNNLVSKIVVRGTRKFNFGDKLTITIQRYVNQVLEEVILQAYDISATDVNKYIGGGYVYDGTSYNFCIFKLDSDGNLNTNFGTNNSGISVLDTNIDGITTYDNYLRSIAIRPDGKIIATGYSFTGTKFVLTTVRTTKDGLLDPSFGSAGWVITESDEYNLRGIDLALSNDNKIVLTGRGISYTNSNMLLTRYSENGSIDSTFVNKVNNITFGNCTYNSKNGKSTLSIYNKYHSILFYRQGEPFCSVGCGQGPRANYNLGWLLGFRDQEYSPDNVSSNTANIFSFYSESLVDTFGPKYFLLSIDDYNSNQINKALISIENVQDKVDVPSYYSADLTPDPNCNTSSNNLYTIPSYLQGRPPQITQAQQYSLNEILKNRKTSSNEVLTSPTNSNLFALIPLKRSGLNFGDSLIEFSGPIQANERNYFGPVDIDKIRVQLLDDKGNIVNLNGMDWSFSILTEHLYQY